MLHAVKRKNSVLK